MAVYTTFAKRSVTGGWTKEKWQKGDTKIHKNKAIGIRCRKRKHDIYSNNGGGKQSYKGDVLRAVVDDGW